MRKGTASGKPGAAKYVRLTGTPKQLREAMRSIDWKRIKAMTEEEIERNSLDDPDSIVPFDEVGEPQLVLPMPDVAALRRRLKLSQADSPAASGSVLRQCETGSRGACWPMARPVSC